MITSRETNIELTLDDFVAADGSSLSIRDKKVKHTFNITFLPDHYDQLVMLANRLTERMQERKRY